MSLRLRISSKIMNALTDTENANPKDLHVGIPVMVPMIYPRMKNTLPIRKIKGRAKTYFA